MLRKLRLSFKELLNTKHPQLSQNEVSPTISVVEEELNSSKTISKKSGMTLKGISDIRRFFYKNEEPIYFVSATNFNLLGADEWAKSFKFINYIDCFDEQHPNVFVPSKKTHESFESIEDINNYLLEHKEVVDFISSRGGKGKVLFLMFNEKTEQLAKELGLEVCFPSAEMRTHLDNKVQTTIVANKANVPSVPNILAKVSDYQQLRDLSKDLGSDLVIQTPFGDSGHTTFFISNEEDWDKHAEEIAKEDKVKVMKRINCRGSAIEACVTEHGTVIAPLMTELVGFESLTPYKGGWCGNEIFAGAFSQSIREQAFKYTKAFGDQLKEEGYRGYFELDFLIDQDEDVLYLGELNPRITGASSITNHAVFALADIPLWLFHMLEWFDVDYKIDVDEINERWSDPVNIDSWSQLVIKHTDDDLGIVINAPQTGIWKIQNNAQIEFSRFDTHRRAVESESEFFFLRILNNGDYIYEGADLGIVVTRGRLMTEDYQLTHRAQSIIKQIRSQFAYEKVNKTSKQKLPLPEIGSFKML